MDDESRPLTELRRLAHHLIKLLHRFALLVDEQLRVTHHVDEQDVRDLEVRIGFQLGGHVCATLLRATSSQTQMA
jgi:hypothetical protein